MDKGYIELDEMDIMLRVPAGACALELTAIMMDEDNKTYKVSRVITPAELFRARENFLKYIGDDYDTTYVLTENGKEWLELLRKERSNNNSNN